MIIIAAIAQNGIIGRDNDLPWRLSGDLRRFKRLTSGHAIVMGRRTWESLPGALPKRRNLVLTRDRAYVAEGATCIGSLNEALEQVQDTELFVIGGAAVYQAALPLADRMELTWVEAEVEGDVSFPSFDLGAWTLVQEEAGPGDGMYPYRFATYVRQERDR